jgi:hypothetical protein
MLRCEPMPWQPFPTLGKIEQVAATGPQSLNPVSLASRPVIAWPNIFKQANDKRLLLSYAFGDPSMNWQPCAPLCVIDVLLVSLVQIADSLPDIARGIVRLAQSIDCGDPPDLLNPVHATTQTIAGLPELFFRLDMGRPPEPFSERQRAIGSEVAPIARLASRQLWRARAVFRDIAPPFVGDEKCIIATSERRTFLAPHQASGDKGLAVGVIKRTLASDEVVAVLSPAPKAIHTKRMLENVEPARRIEARRVKTRMGFIACDESLTRKGRARHCPKLDTKAAPKGDRKAAASQSQVFIACLPVLGLVAASRRSERAFP